MQLVQVLLHNNMLLEAIQLNLRFYKFEHALELARQSKGHPHPQSAYIGYVLSQRQQYLERFRQNESLKIFKDVNGKHKIDHDAVQKLVNSSQGEAH